MTSPLPPVIYEAQPATPQGYGLYAAANITDVGETARILGGVTLRPYNCDTGASTYGVELCPEDPPEKVIGERGEPVDFSAMVVYAMSECAPDQTETEVMSRARHTRTLHEPLLVESAFATLLAADAPAPTVVPDMATAIGVLEAEMGEWGFNGYIHASRRWAAEASQYRWTNQTGPVLKTPLDSTWVFGGGYAALGNVLIATGPLYVWRAAPIEEVVTTGSHSVGAYNNTVTAISERVIAVGYECGIVAVEIDPTP